LADLASVISDVRRRVRDEAPPPSPVPRSNALVTFCSGEPHRTTLKWKAFQDKAQAQLLKQDGTEVLVAHWDFVDESTLELLPVAFTPGASWLFSYLSTDPLYADATYVRAVEFALSKLQFDFQPATPWTIETMPVEYEFLLQKLATIEVCYVRASESTDPSEGSDVGDVSQLTVPDLSVLSQQRGDLYGPSYWYRLAETLQREYDGETANRGPGKQRGEVTSHPLMRKDNLHDGRISDRRLDRGVAPAGSPTVTYVAGVITVTWPTTYSDHFYRYIIEWKAPGSGTWTVLVNETDNHVTESEITQTLVIGAHGFRLAVENDNNITLYGSAISVVVT